MQLPSECHRYICGEEFSSAHEVRYRFDAEDFILKTRHEIMQSFAKDRNVVHVGCVDHSIKQIKVKLKHDQWVHKLVSDAAARCVGVDIIADCVAYIRDELGYTETYVGDILNDEFPFWDGTVWDYVLLPEVLEHIDNPVSFLTALRRRMQGRAARLIVSVPNASSSVLISHAKRGMELINTDHRYVFTPYTLAKISSQAGFNIHQIRMCMYGKSSRRNLLTTRKQRRSPLLRDDIIMELIPNFDQ
jgi:SAM-dependent methyltransferase